MFKKGLKLFIYPIKNLLYFFSVLFPKNKFKWVFGAWFGNRYSDNTKYFFEYMNRDHPKIRAIWITKNKDLISILQKKGFEVYFYLSFLGIWHVLTAKVCCVCCGKEDINRALISFRNFRVNLWHGTPLKKIMYDDAFSHFASTFNRIKMFIFPFLALKFDLFPAPSKKTQDIFISAFQLPRKKIPISGYPRNDIFFQTNQSAKLVSKKHIQILYAPTHRGEGKGGNVKEILPKLEDLKSLNEMLKRNNAILYLRLHYYDQQFLPKNINQFSHVKNR